MITSLEKIRLQAADVAAAAAAMEKLLGWPSETGEEGASFRLEGLALDIDPSDTGADGLSGLVFGVDDLGSASRTCERRALQPSSPVAFAESDTRGRLIEGRRIDLSVEATHGVPVSLIQYAARPEAGHNTAMQGAITGIDHVVIRTTHPNRAAALYGARLGLDLRLDRTEPRWNTRFMFFKCGDLVIEVTYTLNVEPSDAPDQLWGVTWRVDDIEAAHARLAASGFDISEVRTGRKPGTRVFTVRNNTLGVPTLILQSSMRSEA